MTFGAFGPIVLPGQIEAAIRDVLQTWTQLYLHELERLTQRDIDALPAIQSWVLANAAEDGFPEAGLPGVQITWGPMPMIGHAESLTAQPEVVIEVLHEGPGFNEAREVVGLYTYALALIVVQKLDKHELISDVTAPTLDLITPDPSRRRSLALGTVLFQVTVDDVMSPTQGPAATDIDPPPDYPTVLTTDLDVELTDT